MDLERRMDFLRSTAIIAWTRLHTGTAVVVALTAYVVFELFDGRIRDKYCQTWIARDDNPIVFWTLIALQVAVIGLCAWAASTYRQ